MDAECRKLTASFVRAKNDNQSYCSFFNVCRLAALQPVLLPLPRAR